ncbi:prepilin-type N-terminal cleavage/methylation domain-containing protein [Geomonas sp. Red32]|uniref:PilW family protein n=1 Tax=Geomonas sp. Red32 TaxID=2912856 RepID=UPI00202CE0AA|nr:prepilin-type N-terminal cleavage/methylation domain-containing protein [Geomonas sp. Red32]MCM0083694.1 prepilin-type N-terminal cleavage/methylation domain-containing protein [Geomonas sp. Red32]
MRLRSEKGFSLIEMVMTMAIFSVVIMVVANSFSALLKFSSGLMKSEESNISGMVGLEMMRHDLSAAGFGLPTSYNISGVPNYSEVDGAHTLAAALNDSATAGRIPRALVGTANAGIATDVGSDGVSYQSLGNSDYLAIKGSSLGTQPAAQNWSYLNYTSAPPKAPKTWPTVGSNLNAGDAVIALDRSISSTTGGYDLLKDSTGRFWTTYSPSGLPASFSPLTPQDVVYIYGLGGSGTVPRMPFNRVDYMVATPTTAGKLPAYCAPHTGILYRGVVRHDPQGGNLEYQPVLDCVAAMRVVLGWNMFDSSGTMVSDATKTGSGMVDTWTNLAGAGISCSVSPTPDLTTLSAQMLSAVGDPAQIRTKLKVIKVYILAQDGNKDQSYTSSSIPINMYSSEEGATPLGSTLATYTLPPEMTHYHWKVYKLVIRPKNLVSNQ